MFLKKNFGQNNLRFNGVPHRIYWTESIVNRHRVTWRKTEQNQLWIDTVRHKERLNRTVKDQSVIIGVACQSVVWHPGEKVCTITCWWSSSPPPQVFFFFVPLFYDQLWPKGNGHKRDRANYFALLINVSKHFGCTNVVHCKAFSSFVTFWFHSIENFH